MKKMALAALLAAGLVATAAPAAAGDPALTGFTDGFLALSGSDQLYGWFFDTSADIEIDALGVGDNGAPGLAGAHDVGIFRVSDQSLLVSATVPSGTGGTLLDGFRYTSISPFSLAAGSYAIVMTMPVGVADSQIINASSVTTASPVSYVTAAFGAGSSLAYVPASPAFDDGMFGPNFTFTTGVVPEPGTWALMLLGFGGLGVAVRTRRRVAAA